MVSNTAPEAVLPILRDVDCSAASLILSLNQELHPEKIIIQGIAKPILREVYQAEARFKATLDHIEGIPLSAETFPHAHCRVTGYQIDTAAKCFKEVLNDTYNRELCWHCGEEQSGSVTGRSGTSKCSQCCLARYCSQRCQKKHWKTVHKHACRECSAIRNTMACEKTSRKAMKHAYRDLVQSGDVMTADPNALPDSRIHNLSIQFCQIIRSHALRTGSTTVGDVMRDPEASRDLELFFRQMGKSQHFESWWYAFEGSRKARED